MNELNFNFSSLKLAAVVALYGKTVELLKDEREEVELLVRGKEREEEMGGKEGGGAGER